MAHHQLTEGSLRVIMTGGTVEFPIMQVLGSKKISSGKPGDSERYRLLLSDGKNLISFAMLSTQINAKITSGDIPTFSIIKINRHITSVIAGSKDKRVLVILDLELMASGDEVGGKIGNPEQLSDMDMSQAATNGAGSSSVSNADSGAAPPKPKTFYTNSSSNGANLNSSSLQDQLVHPISSLTPYQNKWVIKARVMNKSAVRTWSNSRGEGKLFSMDLCDESGEIRATAFKEAVDKYYDLIEIDKVYYINKCQLKPANKQYSTLNNAYEMTFSNETVVQECFDADITIPGTVYDFTAIDKIANIEVGSFIDVIGVCKSTSDLMTFQAKTTGRELKKKEVVLVDQSNNAISLTLWGGEAENFEGSNQPVIVIKGAKVGEFGGGKNLSTGVSSIMKINPDIPEAHHMKGWYDNTGAQSEAVNISARSGAGFKTEWMSFREVQDSDLGNSDKGDYYQVKGTIMLMRSENCVYKACPADDCNKKVIDMQNDMFRCEKCNREYPSFKYRLLAAMNVGDWSGNTWINTFSNEAEKVLGATPQEVGQAFEEGKDALTNLVNKVNFKEFIFKCRAKREAYNDESHVKTVAVKVDNINYKEYNAYLLSRISALTG